MYYCVSLIDCAIAQFGLNNAGQLEPYVIRLYTKIREKLSKEYEKNPKLRIKRLAAIRKKYGLTVKPKKFASH